MRVYLVVLLLLVMVGSASSQPLKYAYIGNKNFTILSEKVHLPQGDQTINSLFVWQKDRVVRILFKYEKTVQSLKELKLTDFNSFLPSPNYDFFYRIFGYEFANKVNAWNSRFNTDADSLKYEISSHGGGFSLIRNLKRNNLFANNLPLVISEGANSHHIIKPYRIDIYVANRLLGSDHNNVPKSKSLQFYSLAFSIQFLDDSILDAPQTEFNKQSYSLDYFIFFNTLRQIMFYPLPREESLVIKSLSKRRFSQRGYAPPPIKYELQIDELHNGVKLPPPSNVLPKNTPKFCVNEFQYCPTCYTKKLSKATKIKNHCPLNLTVNYKAYKPEFNCSYDTLLFGKVFFKTEIRLNRIYSSANVWQVDPWLIISPGLGYWMSDMSQKSTYIIRKLGQSNYQLINF
jgi:hypothetical protein